MDPATDARLQATLVEQPYPPLVLATLVARTSMDSLPLAWTSLSAAFTSCR
jgi:hypothetical protein